MRSFTGAGLMAFIAVTALGVGGRASDARITAPESGAGWLQLRTGLTFADTLTLDDFARGLESVGDPGLVLGIGVHWRTTRLDFGVIFESASSWSFAGVSRDNRVGAQFRLAANLRWRYIEDHWGALYLALTPGLAVLSHAPALRFQAAQLSGSPERSVDTHTLGFTFGVDFGVLIYLSDELALALHLDLVSSSTALDTDRGEVDLDMVRGIFAVGLEWRM